jgi:site-specific recombinase XerD
MTNHDPMSGTKIADTFHEWRYTMRAAKKSNDTIISYLTTTRQFLAFLETEGFPTTVEDITVRHGRMFLAHLLDKGLADTSVRNRWAGLRAYFTFCVSIDVISDNPMDKLEKPAVTMKVIPEVDTRDIKALVKSCNRKTYIGMRDLAIMHLLMLGLRRSEIVRLNTDDVKIGSDTATVKVMGKGAKERNVGLYPETVIILTSYMRARTKWLASRSETHPAKHLPALFVSKNGRLTGRGLEHMITRRCDTLGIRGANPHAWRHTWAGKWKAAGGSDEGLMAQGGWANSQQIRRYTAHNRERSAIAESMRLNLSDV